MELDRFIGDEATISLEHRILNTVLLIGVLIAFVTTLTNYLLGFAELTLISVLCVLSLCALYYLSLVRRAYRLALIAAVSLAFAIIPFFWFTSGGMAGSTAFYILICAAMITVSVKSRPLIYFLIGCLAVMATGLTAMQYFFPELIGGYEPLASLYADKFIGLTIALIVITALYVNILNYYRREHDRATEYLVKLEKHETALEMARLDRLNLIGEMAASIGHEVRNPLTTIRGFLQLFRNKPDYEHHREHFDIMIGELDRANAIITEFLSLAKNKAVRLQPCDINEILGRIVPLIQAGALEAGKEVALKLKKVPVIEADEREIRQLVLNLTSNALDAITPAGLVTIGTYRDKNRAVLFVSDTGKGIPPEIYAKLGTPFVTGKDNGTGLGIPICYRIAERHKAKIEVDTGSKGTTFRVRFSSPRRQPEKAAEVGGWADHKRL